LFFLFEPKEETELEWKRRISCSLCFVKRFFKEQQIDIPAVPYRVYISSSHTEIKSLIFQVSGGTFHLQPNAASAPMRGALFSEQRAKPIMDVHEYIHLLMDNMRYLRNKDKKKEAKPGIPIWFKEGLAHYVQSRKSGISQFELARSLTHLPPVVLKELNVLTEKLWLEFGIMDQYVATGNHPGLTACASFLQFLVEKEKIGFKKLWELVYFEGGLGDFYRKIEELTGSSFYDTLNNYLYYVDKPFLPRDRDVWEMPVAVARDFRGEFVFEKKSFKVLKPWENNI